MTRPTGKKFDAFYEGLSAARAVAAGAATPTDILREWFGGERYARDHEYLDASYGKRAQQVVNWLASTPASSAVDGRAAPFDVIAHLYRQREFSLSTFGPGARRKGVCDHIRKELDEIEADPDGHGECEWIDVIILGFDGALRSGKSPEEIIGLIVAKQSKNESRTWPDWRTADPDKAIEHDRSGE